MTLPTITSLAYRIFVFIISFISLTFFYLAISEIISKVITIIVVMFFVITINAVLGYMTIKEMKAGGEAQMKIGVYS